MRHGPIVRHHHEVKACDIIIDGIRRDHSPEVKEVGVDFLDFLPHSLENGWFHFVVASDQMLIMSPYT
jgi:hypothetical protein